MEQVVFFVLSKTLDLVIAPTTWIVLAVLLAGALVWRRSPRRGLVVGLLSVAVATVTVLGNPMVANRLWLELEEGAPATWREDRVYDAVVLLGGVVPLGVQGEGEERRYDEGVERLLVTFDMLRLGRAKAVVISGGSASAGPGELVEADALAAQLVDWGVARDRILVEGRSLNTRQNAVETRAILEKQGLSSVVLVTSAFHAQRALGCFRAVGLEPDVRPVDRRAVPPSRQPWALGPRSEALERTSAALRELTGRRVYAALGYVR